MEKLGQTQIKAVESKLGLQSDVKLEKKIEKKKLPQ